MNARTAILIIVAAVAASTVTTPAAIPDPVKTDSGLLTGETLNSGVQVFRGIPFGAPPIGGLRWREPPPVQKWEGVREAKYWGSPCVQNPAPNRQPVNVTIDLPDSPQPGEDCLYLNVWTQANRANDRRPVMVWIYGGAYTEGGGNTPHNDGENLAKKGVVLVNFNYRLGIFGFYAHPELTKESPHKASGNYALLDQSAALRWVERNIAAFGGDPKKVTIAGESAGSIAVSAQMASPLSKNLIAGAIGESGAGINPTLAPVSLHEAEKIGLDFAKNAGYNTIGQLRALPTRDIYEMYNESKRFGFPTVIDGYFYPKSLPEIFKAKEQAKIPLLVGWNSAEIPGIAFMQGLPYNEENYVKKVREAYPESANEVLKLYP